MQHRPIAPGILVIATLAAAACGDGTDDASADTTTVTDTATTITTSGVSSTAVATTPPTTAASTIAAPATPTPTTAAPTTAAPATAVPPTAAPTTAPPTSAPAGSAPSIESILATGQVLNLAHAGGDQEAPHSTRFAFDQAVAAGADALELDVQLTADGKLVVQHDDTVDKTTESTGPVSELTLAEIQALDNAYWFSPECWPCQDRPVEEYIYRGVRTGDVPPPPGADADDFRVPTFREIATAYPDLPLDIEIKGSGNQALSVAGALAAELDVLQREDSVVVVSFDDDVVEAFHELQPRIAVSPGLGRLTAWFLGDAELEPHFRVLQLPPFQGDIAVVTPELVDRVHAEGRVVWVWPDDAATQENEAFYRTLIDAGVDGVIAGRPSEMTAALAAG